MTNKWHVEFDKDGQPISAIRLPEEKPQCVHAVIRAHEAGFSHSFTIEDIFENEEDAQQKLTEVRHSHPFDTVELWSMPPH